MKVTRLDVIVQEHGGYSVYSEDRTKRLGHYRTLGEAQKRLAQIEYFKAKKVRLDSLTPEQRRQQVAHEIALYRLMGGARAPRPKPKKVLPLQASSRAIAVEYASALRKLFQRAVAAYQPLIQAIKNSTVRTDAVDPKRALPSKAGPYRDVKKGLAERALPSKSGSYSAVKLTLPSREAKRLLDKAQDDLESAVSTSDVATLAAKFAARTASHQRLQLGKQVRSALGADPYTRDPVLAGVSEDFVAQNVSLIKRIPSRLHEKIEGMVMNSVGKSQLNVNLGDEIRDAFGVADRHAAFIARDQISKYYGAVNKARQESLGVTKFIWRTMNDERVRDSHAELDGKEFSWDDLPTNDDGEEIYPGSDYQCRCTAEPVLDDLVDDVDDAEDTMTPETFADSDEFDQDEEQDD